MISYNKETPILLVASGFSENIQQIYSELKQIEPQRLYIVYDAPAEDKSTTEEIRIESVFNEIGWKCEVKILRSKKHLGHDAIMLKAIRWFFRQEKGGIVLSGYGVPFPALFAFWSCLLEKYRDDERIGHISGWDFLKKEGKKPKAGDSYYFSKLTPVSSGWASWRRVWKDVDAQLKTFPIFKKLNIIENIPSHKPFRHHWHYLEQLEDTQRWNFRYEYANLVNNRLAVIPDFRQIPLQEYELPEIGLRNFFRC